MPKKSSPAPVHCCIEVADPHAHLFRVTLTITQPQALQLVSLPVWIPGSYLVREFAKNLQKLVARQGRKTLPATQVDKCSWQIACDPEQPLELSYEVYAWDNSVRTPGSTTSAAFSTAPACVCACRARKTRHTN